MYIFHSKNILVFRFHRTVYTCALNGRGGVESDFMITKIESGSGQITNPKFDVSQLAFFFHSFSFACCVRRAACSKYAFVNLDDASRAMLNAHAACAHLDNFGGAAVSYIRFQDNGYYIVADGASTYHTLSHIQAAIAERKFDVNVQNVTDRVGIISVQGPQR